MTLAAESNVEPFVPKRLFLQPFGDLRLSQQLDHAAFEHPRPDAVHHVVSALPLQDNGVDAVQMQKL